MNLIQEAPRLGRAVWIDYIGRGLLKSGELQQLINQRISGMTSNPTIFEKAIVGSTGYDKALLASAQANKSVEETCEALTMEDICVAADLLRPTYDRSGGPGRLRLPRGQPATAGIDMASVTAKLLTDGVKAFVNSFEELLAGIQEKRTRLLT